MSVSFQCPSCMGTLYFDGGDSAFQTCRHCSGKIIVPSEAFHQHDLQHQKPTRQAITARRERRLAQVQHSLDTGNKIEAIKVFRESFGTDLATAKAAVERMQQGAALPKADLTPRRRPVGSPGASAIQKPQQGCSPAAGKIVSVIIQIVIFLAIIYWFFN